MFDFEDFAARHYTEFAAAFCRGHLGLPADTSAEAAIGSGVAGGLRLHKFKKNAQLPRVRVVLGVLKALAPACLLDVGSGRGTFLWPLLDAFPALSVTSVDAEPRRTADLESVRQGGVARLAVCCADACHLDFDARAFEVVTALEVLEHISEVDDATRQILRVARRFVIVSVPSKADDNPEHLRLFDETSLTELLQRHGARRVTVDYVHNHMIAVAGV